MDELKGCSGVYAIEINSKLYVGSSKDLRERWKQHRGLLTRNKHQSPKLQYAWNKYRCAFFEVLCKCPISCLLGMEQYWMDKLKPYYNICPLATSCGGRKLTEEHKRKIAIAHIGLRPSEDTLLKMRGRVITPLMRQHLSESHQGQIPPSRKGCISWNKGKLGGKLSEEHKRKISLNHDDRRGEKAAMAKLTWEIVNEIRANYPSWKMEGKTFKQIGECYGVSGSAISVIIRNQRWRIE